jgi:hypothetical protein
VAFVALTAANY